jgi:hypothetical protein
MNGEFIPEAPHRAGDCEEMPVEVGGKRYKTIEEAARELNVHPKTLRGYINKNLVSAPPTVANGLVDRRYFPEELIRQYKKEIEDYKTARKPE